MNIIDIVTRPWLKQALTDTTRKPNQGREAAEKRARREENEKRRDENAWKNEVVQQVKNVSQLPFLATFAASRPSIFA